MSRSATTSPRRNTVLPKSPSGAPRTSARGPGSSSSRPSGGLLKRTQQVPRVSGASDAQLYARVSLSAEPWGLT